MSRFSSYPDGYTLQPGDRILVSRQGRTLSVTGAGITSGATPAEQFDDYKRYNDARVQALTEQNSRLIALVEAATGTPLPSLNALYLSSTAFTAGTMFNATIAGTTPGSTITATADDGTALNVTGSLLSGTFTTAGSKTITLTEALAGYFNSPNSNQIVVAVANAGVTPTPTPAPTLNALTVSPSSATVGTAYSGTISGLTSGSSVALSGAGATGLSIAGAVITGTPTMAGAINLVETLAGATGSPRTSSGVVTVAASGGGSTDTNPVALSTANAGRSLGLFAVPGYANVGQPYAMLPAVKGGTGVSGANRSFSLAGTLPPGASFSTSTGEITGTPTTVGSYSGLQITCTMIPTNESAQSQVFTIPVGAAPVTISPSGDTTGATDTAAINAALAAGNSVKLSDGNWYQNAPFIQPGNTAIYLPTGTILLVNGSNCSLWKNANQGSTTRVDQNIAIVGKGSGNTYWNGNSAGQTRNASAIRDSQGIVGMSVQNLMLRGFRNSAHAGCISCFGMKLMQVRDWYPDQQGGTPNQDGFDLGNGSSFIHIDGVVGGNSFDDIFSFYAKKPQSSTAMMAGIPWSIGGDVTDFIINNVSSRIRLNNTFRLQAADNFKMLRLFCTGINNTVVNSDGTMVMFQFGELSFLGGNSTPPAASDMGHIYVDGGGTCYSRLIHADSHFSNVYIRGLALTRSLTYGITTSSGSPTSYNNVFFEDITESGTRNHGSLYDNTKTTGAVSSISFKRIALLSANTLMNSAVTVTGISFDTVNFTQNSTTTNALPAVTSSPASTGTLTNVTAAGVQIDPGTSGLTYTGGAGTPTISFAAPTANVAEGNTGTTTVTNTINVTRNGVTGDLIVNLGYGGTATSGTDYVTPPTTATILAGQNSVSFNTAINGDTTVEPDETIIITGTLAAYTSSTATKTITITNDDSAGVSPTLSDSFTGADSATIASHTPEVGGAYTLVSGGFVITSNQARPGARPSEVQNATTFAVPMDVAVDLSYVTLIASTTQYIKVAIDANNYYLFGSNNGVFQIRKVAAGAASAPIGTNTGAAPSATGTNSLRPELRNGSQSLYLNNVLVASATDTLLDGATVKVGLVSAGSGAAAGTTTGERFDNLMGTPR